MRRAAVMLIVLSGLARPASAQRLPTTVVPEHYDLTFAVDLTRARFDGTETIHVQVREPTSRVVLNAFQIDFQDVTIEADGAVQTATVTLDPQTQQATLAVPQVLATGTADIHVRYRGLLNDELRGFYLSHGANRRYAVTQFESTDARRAFPCFDEPAFKATFAITLVVDRGDTAISNGALVADTPGPAATEHTLTFATSPEMSTYLVAMAVGDFQCLAGSADDVPIRICATPDKKALGAIALESAEQILRYYDRYYAIKYPFKKLDVLAVPDFAAGAMENTAAIFYRETDLLAETGAASLAVRKRIASVLAHEMAHQWFGDLVTMQWWDDIWLNEGFATWMANHPLADWKPEWDIPVDAALETQAALNLDSLQATHPIHVAVRTPAQIEEAFDTIAYEKGAAVLRMIESYVGPETFRKGVNTYLAAHAYGNATSEDFWNAIAATSGKPVDRILPTFVNQAGAPLVSVTAACAADRTEVTLAQQRFFLDPALLGGAGGERWQVPVCEKADGRPEAACLILASPSTTTPLGAGGCAAWVFANAGAHGYYRTAYTPDMLRILAPRVEDALTAPERLSLAGDEWALVRAGRHSAADYLTLASGFGREQTSGVLDLVVGRLGFIHEYLTTDQTRGGFERFTRSLLRPLYDDLGSAAGPGDSDARRALRAVVVGGLGETGQDPEVVDRARTAVDGVLSGGPPLDPTLAGTLVTIAAEHGDAALYDRMLAAAERAASPDEHYRYLYALTRFREPALIERSLRFALTPALRSQDGPLYLGAFMANPGARATAWSFVKQHWTELEPKITIAQGDMAFVGALSAFCDAQTRDDIEAFFAAHPLPSATRTLRQTLERIDNCIALHDHETPAVTKWLSARR